MSEKQGEELKMLIESFLRDLDVIGIHQLDLVQDLDSYKYKARSVNCEDEQGMLKAEGHEHKLFVGGCEAITCEDYDLEVSLIDVNLKKVYDDIDMSEVGPRINEKIDKLITDMSFEKEVLDT